jgi:hypothetical protein
MCFVARLLELKPALTPAAAVVIAIKVFDECSGSVDPAEAAQSYAEGMGAKG